MIALPETGGPVTAAAWREHLADPFAHSPMEARLRNEIAAHQIERDRELDARQYGTDARLGRLERFQYMTLGGLVTASTLMGAGIVTLWFHAVTSR